MPLTLKHSSRILSLERVGILGIAHTYRIVSLDDLEKIPGSKSHGEHLGWNPIKDKCRLVYGCICFGKSMFTHSLHVKTEGDMEMVYMENGSLPFHRTKRCTRLVSFLSSEDGVLKLHRAPPGSFCHVALPGSLNRRLPTQNATTTSLSTNSYISGSSFQCVTRCAILCPVKRGVHINRF